MLRIVATAPFRRETTKRYQVKERGEADWDLSFIKALTA